MKIKMMIGILFFILMSCNSSEFNSKKWKQGDARQRGKMSSDLIKKGILENKSRNKIFELLGTPNRADGGCVSYDLDLGGYNKIVNWTYFLEICFNEKNGSSNYIQIND